MNILILGGLGFLGRNLEKKLSETHKVFVTDCVENTSQNYYKVRLSETQNIIKIIEENEISIVIHLISSIIPSSNMEQYFYDLQEVYMPSMKIMEYCAENQIKFVYFSSGGAVYGNQKEIFNEHTKREPVSFYGLSKFNFENTITFFHNTRGLEYLIIRPSNPYGFGQNINGKQGIIAVIIGKILKNEPIQIWGDGTAVKDYIYIDDFVLYVLKLIESNETWNQIFNIGSGIGSSINDVLSAFRNNNIVLPVVEYISENKADVKRMILDCTKIQEICPIEITPLQIGIEKFWEKINGRC